MTKRGDGDREEREPTRITVKDNRRIDPTTGQPRDLPQPGAAADGSGDPLATNQPVTAGASGGSSADAAELEAARSEAAERTADLQRMAAEYANYRKRADRDKQAAGVAGKASVVLELLAVLDDIDRADEHGDLTGGFKTVADKLIDTLTKQGLAVYGAEGDEFDPNLHEAVQFGTSGDVDQPTVTTVLRRGYTFDERVLRPAVVVVTGPEHGGDGPAAGDGPESGEGHRAEGGDDGQADGDASSAAGGAEADAAPTGDEQTDAQGESADAQQ